MEDVLPLSQAVDQLRSGNRSIEPFHWEIEFPEVFGRENGAFDVIVGNPPFAGKNTLINSHRDGYLDWLKAVHEESHGNAERIFPYIGGQEVNDNSTHTHHRYVINFGDMSEEEAWQWPDLMRIVEEKVKPTRLRDNRASYRNYWWQYAEKQIDLHNTIRDLDRVLVCSRIGNAFAFTFLPHGMIMNEKIVVFPFQQTATFSVIQSRLHETWARFFSSTLKDDLQYTPSLCFETFPFPKHFETNERLETIGKECYDFRTQLMVANNEGLTKTYNRFHDPSERSPEIQRLRELHDAMDWAVLDAYGWTDLVPTCDFLLDYEEDEDEDDGSSRRKKPWRYRWPDDFRDEVLARLLDLNAQCAEQERLAGLTAEATRGKSKGRKKRAVRGEQPKLL